MYVLQWRIMQTVESALKTYINDESVFFVFPTDIAASCWADYALNFTEAVALERFTAWDRFKSEAVRAVHQDKNSIPAALRKLFALRLLERNARELFFTSLIPADYAQSAAGFADWLAALLPQLALWKKKHSAHSAGCDNEDADLYKLEELYRVFLDENALFEPAWEMPPFEDGGKKYIIVYPEILQDFEEYRLLLEKSPNVQFVAVPDGALDAERCDCVAYSNTRTELRETALYIRSLCAPVQDSQRPRLNWTDIAVSVPDAENLIPYVMREFGLYNIPVQLRSGKKLGLYSGGNLFSLIQNCKAEDFSFDSVRSLLTDPAFPWKDEAAVNQLIDFGIKHNCLCPYDGIDVWEQAFSKAAGEERAHTLYRLLKKQVSAVASARSFQKLREQYFAFRSAFFNPELFTEKSNRILSRCISELGSLIDIELSYPKAAECENPLAFFVSVLDSKDYLAQNDGCGVSIFSYKVASCAPFKQHIVLNASQNALGVVYRPLSFLHETKRFGLRVADNDVSAAFARLYAAHSASTLRVSCARKSFSGYTVVHTVFDACVKDTGGNGDVQSENGGIPIQNNTALYPDYFAAEKKFLLGYGQAPAFLHSIQKKGFDAYAAARSEHGTFLSPDFIRERILNYARDADTGKVKVSASALKAFYTCPRLWLFSRVLHIEEYKTSASVTDEVFIGILYHEIIKRVLRSFKERAWCIGAEEASGTHSHGELIALFTHEVIDGFPESCALHDDVSPLTVEHMRTQEPAIAETLCAFFYEFTLWFSGARILAAEEPLRCQSDDFILNGTIDCVLDTAPDDSGRIYIVDFKTAGVPKFGECIQLPENTVKDFQLASYIQLYENVKCAGRPEVAGAGFFSIHNAEPTSIVGSLVSNVTGKRKPYREKDTLERTAVYKDGVSSVDGTLQTLQTAAQAYADTLGNPDATLFCRGGAARFSDGSEVPYKTCASCVYKALCRTAYSLGRTQ